MRSILTLAFSAAALLAAPATLHARPAETSAQRPNIIFIMSDDHAYQAISAYGSNLSKLAPTPNIDRIARRGATFLNSYVTNSLCGPSRGTMLTGQFSHVHGLMRNGQQFDNGRWVWPRALAKAGYDTALFGKWHLNKSPEGIGLRTWKVLDDQGEYYNPDFIDGNGQKRVEGYATDLITEYSLDWLKSRRDQTKPFALLIHHKAPHRNFMPALRYVQKYLGKTFPVPDNYFDHYDGRPSAAGQEMMVSRHMHEGHDLKMTVGVGSSKLRYDPWPQVFQRLTSMQRTEWDRLHQRDNDAMNAAKLSDREMAVWKYQRYLAEYLGTVAAIDEGVGKVLDHLEATGLDRNTIVVYTSDQGFYLGEHGWFDKRFIYEESLRTPLLVQYPGRIPAGRRIAAPVQNIDYAPTFLDYAGLAAEPSVQGRSIRKVAEGKAPRDWRKDIYYHYYEYPDAHKVRAHYGIRSNRYKLVRFYGDINNWEFYDLKNDPTEMRNRIADPKVQPVIAALKRRLIALRREYKDGGGPTVD